MSPRMTAEDRRAQVIRAAVAEFSVRGLEGTSTSDIAKRVGVSQPYLFRLFPTKKDLFIAATARGAERVIEVFTKAADGKYGEEALAAMGLAYQELLDEDSELLGMQLQQFAACHDPDVQRAVRGTMQAIWAVVENASGAPVEERVTFFAKGMLCNAIAAMGRADGADPVWQPILDVLREEVTPAESATGEGGDTATDTGTDGGAAGDADKAAGLTCAPGDPGYSAYAAGAFGEKTAS
jgi:AcrR family transcriptional regulator